MKWIEIVRVALSSLRANKLRSALTVLGIIIGIFSIISISTIITMLQNSIEEGLSMLGKDTFQIQKYPAIQMGRMSETVRRRKNITFEQYQRLKSLLTEAKYVAAEQWRFGRIAKSKWEVTNPDISLAGITRDAQLTNQWVIAEGRALNSNDLERNRRVCIIGADVVQKLFKRVHPLDQEIKVDGLRLTVVGVFEPRGQIFGESRDNFLAIPLSTFQNKFGKTQRSINITIMAQDGVLYNDTIEAAIGYMRTIRKVPPGEENDFDIFSNESLIMQIGQITRYVELGAIVVALIALLAAGVGIMNIMLVSVTERTREIGIRKAIGAKRRNILVQFLLEAIVLCQLGGLLGIFFGVMVGNLAGQMLKAHATVPLQWMFVGVLLCVTVGVMFGTYPAYKAANLDPIEALRYE